MFLPPHKCLQFSNNPISQKLPSFYIQPWSGVAGVQISQFSLNSRPPSLLLRHAAILDSHTVPRVPHPT